MSSPSPIHVGFLTILEQESGLVGGYLVTNNWGRPMEFRLSSAVKPNQVQKILYAHTMRAYLCADLIGKTLIEKTGVDSHLIVTDTEDVLELRHQMELPVLWMTEEITSESRHLVQKKTSTKPVIYSHERYTEDEPKIQEFLNALDGLIDLREPFERIREAIGEARKLGVTNRAA